MPSLNKMSEDNIIYIVRLICLIFLLVILFYQQTINHKIKEPIIQIIIALIVIFVFVFIDPLSGFFIACSVFIIYYKFYSKVDINIVKNKESDKKNNIPYGSYITQDHLDMAQDNNVVGTPTSEFELSKMEIFNNPNPEKLIPGYEKPFNTY
jgi:TM2 domain-containing membrane protein YozV